MLKAFDPAVFARDVVRPHLAFLLDAPRRQLFKAAALALFIGACGVALKSEYGLFYDPQETRCMPEKLFVGFPRHEVLVRGDIVSYRANSRMMLDLMTGRRLGKIVAAVPGDRVVSNASGAYVNGVLVGHRNATTLKNIAAKGKSPVDINKVLQPGELFVIGTLPRSFDSRYWGVLRDESVDRQLKAIL